MCRSMKGDDDGEDRDRLDSIAVGSFHSLAYASLDVPARSYQLDGARLWCGVVWYSV